MPLPELAGVCKLGCLGGSTEPAVYTMDTRQIVNPTYTYYLAELRCTRNAQAPNHENKIRLHDMVLQRAKTKTLGICLLMFSLPWGWAPQAGAQRKRTETKNNSNNKQQRWSVQTPEGDVILAGLSAAETQGLSPSIFA